MFKLIATKFLDSFSLRKQSKNSIEKKLIEPSGEKLRPKRNIF